MSAAATHRGVAVVHVPREPSQIRAHLEHCWALDEPRSSGGGGGGGGGGGATTSEDKERTTLYRELSERRSIQE